MKATPSQSNGSPRNKIVSTVKNWWNDLIGVWDRFWFRPQLPHTLSLIRILTGVMLLYSHLVLAADLLSFVGPDSWINSELAERLHNGSFGNTDWGRSYLWHIDSVGILWLHHIVTIVVTTMFMVGFLTRLSGPAACFLQLMYIHRLTGALFGFDQIVTYAAIYLALAPSNAKFSVDAWLRRRRERVTGALMNWLFPENKATVSANIATRLFQLHICVIYLFGGLAKARGETWWDGSAVWFAVGNLEYQSFDMTWLAGYPTLVSLLSNLTLFWEIFFCALIWPRATRPLVLGMVVAVHGGIGLFLGMMTFGLMMIFANIVFVQPAWIATMTGDQRLVPKPDPTTGQGVRRELSKLRRRREKHKEYAEKLNRRHRRLKEREEKYRRRVKKLRERESKIKAIVADRRDRKASESNLESEPES